MKLEKLEPTGSRERVRLRFSDGTSLRVPASVAADLGLRPGLELTEEDLARIREESGKASARLRAVRIVAASGVSERELRRRLVQKGETEAHADAAVQWLDELRLLDDREAARQIVEKGAARGYGRARVRQMLYEKGIGRDLLDEALAALPEPDGAVDRYLAAHLAPGADRKEIKKVTDALQRRGYGWEDIRAGLSRCRAQWEEE